MKKYALISLVYISLNPSFIFSAIKGSQNCLQFERNEANVRNSYPYGSDSIQVENICDTEIQVDSMHVIQTVRNPWLDDQLFTEFDFQQKEKSTVIGEVKVWRWKIIAKESGGELYYSVPDTNSQIYRRDVMNLKFGAHQKSYLNQFRLDWSCPVCKTTAQSPDVPDSVQIKLKIFSHEEIDSVMINFLRQAIGEPIKSAKIRVSGAGKSDFRTFTINGKVDLQPLKSKILVSKPWYLHY